MGKGRATLFSIARSNGSLNQISELSAGRSSGKHGRRRAGRSSSASPPDSHQRRHVGRGLVRFRGSWRVGSIRRLHPRRTGTLALSVRRSWPVVAQPDTVSADIFAATTPRLKPRLPGMAQCNSGLAADPRAGS